MSTGGIYELITSEGTQDRALRIRFLFKKELIYIMRCRKSQINALHYFSHNNVCYENIYLLIISFIPGSPCKIPIRYPYPYPYLDDNNPKRVSLC